MHSSRFYGTPDDVLVTILGFDIGDGAHGDPVLATTLLSEKYARVRVLRWCTFASHNKFDYDDDLPDLAHGITIGLSPVGCNEHNNIHVQPSVYDKMKQWWLKPHAHRPTMPRWCQHFTTWQERWNYLQPRIVKVSRIFMDEEVQMLPKDYFRLFRLECDGFFTKDVKAMITDEWSKHDNLKEFFAVLFIKLLSVNNGCMLDILFELLAGIAQDENFYSDIFSRISTIMGSYVGPQQYRSSTVYISDVSSTTFQSPENHDVIIADECRNGKSDPCPVPRKHWMRPQADVNPAAGPFFTLSNMMVKYSGTPNVMRLFYQHCLRVGIDLSVWLFDLTIMNIVAADRPELLHPFFFDAKATILRQAAIMADRSSFYQYLNGHGGDHCHEDIAIITKYHATRCYEIFRREFNVELLERTLYSDFACSSKTLTLFYGPLSNRDIAIRALEHWLKYATKPRWGADLIDLSELTRTDKLRFARLAVEQALAGNTYAFTLLTYLNLDGEISNGEYKHPLEPVVAEERFRSTVIPIQAASYRSVTAAEHDAIISMVRPTIRSNNMGAYSSKTRETLERNDLPYDHVFRHHGCLQYAGIRSHRIVIAGSKQQSRKMCRVDLTRRLYTMETSEDCYIVNLLPSQYRRLFRVTYQTLKSSYNIDGGDEKSLPANMIVEAGKCYQFILPRFRGPHYVTKEKDNIKTAEHCVFDIIDIDFSN